MKYRKNTLLIIAATLVLGVVLAVPVFADLDENQPHMPQLYYFEEETGEYVPWYPPWYDPENPDSYIRSEGCPWWDRNGDGEFDWMPHWGKRWNNPEDDSRRYGRGRHGGCGRYGSQFDNRDQSG